MDRNKYLALGGLSILYIFTNILILWIILWFLSGFRGVDIHLFNSGGLNNDYSILSIVYKEQLNSYYLVYYGVNIDFPRFLLIATTSTIMSYITMLYLNNKTNYGRKHSYGTLGALYNVAIGVAASQAIFGCPFCSLTIYSSFLTQVLSLIGIALPGYIGNIMYLLAWVSDFVIIYVYIIRGSPMKCPASH